MLARDPDVLPMTSTSSQPRPEIPITLTCCTECRKRKTGCDKLFPQCSKCQKGGRTCVFPESKRGRHQLPTSEQRQLSSNVESQLNGGDQLYISSNDATSATDTTSTAPLDPVLSIPGRVNSLCISTPIGSKSQRIALPPAVTETRVRRCKHNEHVSLAAPKRRIRDKELIHMVQASSRKGTRAPSKQSVCISHE